MKRPKPKPKPKPKHIPLPLMLAFGLQPGDIVTIAGEKGTFIISPPAPPAPPRDYGIRSTNYPKPK